MLEIFEKWVQSVWWVENVLPNALVLCNYKIQNKETQLL
jgi:hypothetical protein